MQFYSVCQILLLLNVSEAFYSFQCPVKAQWKQRSEAKCDFWDRYFCLYDRNTNNFTEFCRQQPDFEAPGQKLIISGPINGTLQGADCDNDFHQPLKFWSSGNSQCAFKKSYCNGEGQLIFSNGTIKKDRSCRCDYTKGYDFIVRPKHRCYCEPAEEECSCYLNLCSNNDILSPDYECLDRKIWKSSFKCDEIVTSISPKDIEVSLTTISWFDPYVPVSFEIEKNRKKAFVAVLSLTLVIIIINASICFFTTNLCSLKSQHRLTEGGEHDDGITTYRPDKPELEENFRNFGNDSAKVPSHIKEFQDETLQDWGRKLNKIVITRAIEFIYQKIMKRNIIVIVGPTGSGKSATAYYAAFKLRKNNGHTIIPVRQPDDITNYHVPGTKQIFIIDDFIGKYAVNETDVYLWEKHVPLLKIIFCKNDDTKLILTSRTSIWQPERYACLSLDAYMCDLLSDHVSLTLTERRDICQSYLNHDDIKALKDETLLMYSFIPSICSSYKSSENIPVERFFAVPYIMIEKEIDNFKIKSQVSFIALAILAIKQTISTNSFAIDNHEFDTLFHDVFHESAFLQYPSKNLLKSSLVALIGTYVKKDIDNFMFIHVTLRNIVLRCIAKTLIQSVIKYCKSDVILNQLRLYGLHIQKDDFTIDVAVENEDAYFRRLIHELGEGGNEAIFQNEQNDFHEFRIKFLKYMKTNLSRDYWTKRQDGMTALHVVSARGYKDYTSFFINDQAMINQKDSAGNIPLHLACMKGDINIVNILVKNKSFIDIENNEGLKPFVYACENNAITVAKFLLHHCDKWIHVNEKYQKRNNGSVLHIVSSKGFVNILLFLLEKNADVNIQDENGYTPLHLASNSAIAKALLDYNANINPVDAFGRSPVYLACCTNQVKVLAVLIEKNADINQKTKTGLRPLHAACQSGSIGIVNMLIEQGAKINRSEPGITPLHEACKNGNECMIHTLIAANASVNHKTNYGLTPLHEACRNDRISAVQILLDNQANVNEANKHGWTALFFSCARGCRAIVDVLLQRDAHVNICDDDKVTPLILACKEEYTDVVDSLLRSKANVNYCEKDNCSSLLIACKTGNVDLVHLLLKYSADINLADIDMITPLHAACMNNNNTKLVLKLVESNANVNAADKNGQTPLFKSICNGNTDIVDSLLRHGALIDIYDTSGLSPVTIANIKGNKTVIDALKQHRPINKIT